MNWRSYYRCTSSACGVKKRVERSCEDPTTVVTTYEGTHAHPCPLTPRGTFNDGGGGGGSRRSGDYTFSSHQYYHHQPPQAIQQQHQPYFHNNLFTFGTNNIINPALFGANHFEERPFCPSASSSSSAPCRDDGLLQDMLPSQMLFKDHQQEEKKKEE